MYKPKVMLEAENRKGREFWQREQNEFLATMSVKNKTNTINI